MKDHKSGFVLPQIAGFKIPFLSGRPESIRQEAQSDIASAELVHEETRRATEEILAKVGFQFPAEFAQEPEETPFDLPAPLSSHFLHMDIAALRERLSITAQQFRELLSHFCSLVLQRFHMNAALPVAKSEPSITPSAAQKPLFAFAGALITRLVEAQQTLRLRFQALFTQIRLRFTKLPQTSIDSDSVVDLQERIISPENDAAALDNLLEGIAIKKPDKKAFILERVSGLFPKFTTFFHNVFTNILAKVRGLPKSVLLIVAVLSVVLFAGCIFLAMTLSHTRHAHVAMLPSREPHRTQIEHLTLPKQAQAHKNLISDGQAIRPSELVAPVEEDGAGGSSSANDAAIINTIRPQIAHLCGLRVSKVLRWKFHQGYLFCYIHAATRNMSTVLERADNGTFTLIGGSNGLMSFDQMTNLFMVDPDIATKLLAK